MTGRERIATRIRMIGIMPVPLMLLAVFLLGCASWDSSLIWLCLLVFVVAFAVAFWVTFRVTCPFCGQWIGQIMGFRASPFMTGLPKKVRYCPLCGADFESEISERTAANQPSQPIAGKPGSG